MNRPLAVGPLKAPMRPLQFYRLLGVLNVILLGSAQLPFVSGMISGAVIMASS